MLEALRPDLHIGPIDPALCSMLADTVDPSIGVPPVVERSSSYRGSSHGDDFLTGWEEDEAQPIMEGLTYEDEDGIEAEDDTILSNSETEASQVSGYQPEGGKVRRVAKVKGKRRGNERGKFREAVLYTRQVNPPPPPHSSKRKAPDPSPVDESVKRTKASEPGGLVTNWKKKVDLGILEHIARKNPIEFVSDEDLVEGEFDKPEGSDLLSAVRASKNPGPVVKLEYKLVSDIKLSCLICILTTNAAWRQICPGQSL
jgi:hypothetical protein